MKTAIGIFLFFVFIGLISAGFYVYLLQESVEKDVIRYFSSNGQEYKLTAKIKMSRWEWIKNPSPISIPQDDFGRMRIIGGSCGRAKRING